MNSLRAAVYRFRRQIALATVFTILYAAGLHWLGFNWTSSMPYHMVWIEYGKQPALGDLIIYHYTGTPLPAYGYINGVRFFKRAAGLAGDEIRVEGREVFVRGQSIGVAKSKTSDGQTLDLVKPGAIPTGFVFAQGESTDAFDSRYAQRGLVPADRIIGVAHVIF